MRRALAVTPALCLCLAAGGTVEAQTPADEIRAAVLDHYASIAAGNPEVTARQHIPEFTGFLSDNGLLARWDSVEDQIQEFQAYWDAGFSVNWDIRHLDVEVYGDVGVATMYAVGTVTWPGQEPRQGTWRVSEVWVKEDGEWKEAHHHDSPLRPAP